MRMKLGFRIRFLVILGVVFSIFMACKDKAEKKEQPETEDTSRTDMTESKQGWTVLFDGTSFDGWNEYLKDGVSEHWKLEDGAMVFYPPQDRKKGESYNLVTQKEFTDFELSLDWRIAEAGNSGIFWGVQEMPSLKQPYQTGPEIQVLDNEKHPDGKNGIDRQAGALYDMVGPSKDVTKPVGQWNTMVIRIDHKAEKGSVHMNGTEIVKFPVGNESWNSMVSQAKFADWEHFGKYTKGKIGLQDHSDVVAYRNIKIREL
ncbi:MAG: DUF1080 domain-containing protein [Bacteroidota bacterium]